jgi:hypothetical protein
MVFELIYSSGQTLKGVKAMSNITKDMFDQKLEDFTLTKVTSIRADSGSTGSKQVTLKVHYRGVTINELATFTLGQGVVVQWQNANRKHFESIGREVEVEFRSPGAIQRDPQMAVANDLANLGEDEREAYIKDLIAKAKEIAKRK